MTETDSTRTIDRQQLSSLLERERATFAADHSRSRDAYRAADHLFGRVPMTWMNKNAGGFPVYQMKARGAHVWDLDGNEYVDLALGDTGAMAGHSPAPVVAAIRSQLEERGGASTMMPTEDAEWVGAELAQRFGLPSWSFSLTATDANRWCIRIARAITGRPKILFNSYCYHGSVDESLIVVGPDGEPASRPGNVGPPCDVRLTSRVAEYNDLGRLEDELACGDVAAILMEPALTNIGLVLPDPGYLEGVRRISREHGVLLINDETHTFSAGWGGATEAWQLEPDFVTIGKAIGGGFPCGAYGLSGDLAEQIQDRSDLDLVDMGGIGGTLAGNPVSVAAMRATLEHVLDRDAFRRMTALCNRLADGVEAMLLERSLPWSIRRLGARAEYRFVDPAPRNGGESAAAHDPELDDYMHVYMLNRGVMLTPFHAMALMSPVTTDEDVDRHNEVFGAAIEELLGRQVAAL
jgi:glutamate-1-semialdehyde 2,1-aminomutase